MITIHFMHFWGVLQRWDIIFWYISVKKRKLIWGLLTLLAFTLPVIWTCWFYSFEFYGANLLLEACIWFCKPGNSSRRTHDCIEPRWEEVKWLGGIVSSIHRVIFNSPSTISLFIWETRLGKRNFQNEVLTLSYVHSLMSYKAS